MENLSRAIIMGGQVLTFIVALTTSVFLYQTLINTQANILIASEEYSRTAERVVNELDSTERIAKGSEIYGVLMSKLEGKDFDYEATSQDYNADIIQINGATVNDLKTLSINYDQNYKIIYSFVGDKLAVNYKPIS